MRQSSFLIKTHKLPRTRCRKFCALYLEPRKFWIRCSRDALWISHNPPLIRYGEELQRNADAAASLECVVDTDRARFLAAERLAAVKAEAAAFQRAKSLSSGVAGDLPWREPVSTRLRRSAAAAAAPSAADNSGAGPAQPDRASRRLQVVPRLRRLDAR